MKIYKFRNFQLHTFERRLTRDGELIELTPRTFDVLEMLVARAGEVVTKDELLGTVWNGCVVEEANLPVHVSKLRRYLNDGYIQTVYGTGYRFTIPVILSKPRERERESQQPDR